jgi:hypothetical protein
MREMQSSRKGERNSKVQHRNVLDAARMRGGQACSHHIGQAKPPPCRIYNAVGPKQGPFSFESARREARCDPRNTADPSLIGVWQSLYKTAVRVAQSHHRVAIFPSLKAASSIGC